MCKDCEQLRQTLIRAFGHLKQSDDPKVRKAAEQVTQTLKKNEKND